MANYCQYYIREIKASKITTLEMIIVEYISYYCIMKKISMLYA